MQTILVCDDDKQIVEAIDIYLTGEGFQVVKAYDGYEALELLESHSIDLMIVDVMMPGLDGMRTTLKVRETSSIPIIILSAKSEDNDKILGLNIGADDYIAKPFNPLELVARVKSHIYIHNLLSSAEKEEEQQETEITYRNLTILPKSRRIYLDKKEVILVNKEFELLLFLAENPNLVFSKDTLFDRVWGMDSLGDAATVTVHINRLRDKLGKNESKNQFIETVWGAGYRFRID